MSERKSPPGRDEEKNEAQQPPQQPPPPNTVPRAALRFLPGWEQRQHGEIRPGGKLFIEYDPSRLPHCRQSSHGAQVWDIEVRMIFHPGGQRLDASVMKKNRMHNGGMIVSLEPQPFEMTVPPDAERVEVWFRNFYTLGPGCEAWDSRFCQNYCYDVVR